ncbi:MAG: valine--tRNA ligase [Candidatus Thermoplasmatota archaeon]
MPLTGDYDHEEVEEKWMKRWEEMDLYSFDPDSDRPVYSIDTPPRYASGFLHMGHAKNYLEFEMVARVRRLLGYEVFFPVGYDDNGLPTERYVEDELGMSKRDIDREQFIKKCREAAEELEDSMTEMFDRIGMSWDWSTFYQTIDDRSIKTAQRSFVELYKDGKLYRDKEPTIWCPYHSTALAQAEVEEAHRETILNYLYFGSEEGKLEIATTRPELLPSCVAVFTHPEDERYGHLVGKKAEVPIFGQEVPIMESEEVDPEFGTGLVMVCTFGDNTDVEMWKQYDLPLRISIDEEGRMNENAGEYQGLKIEEAKEKIIEDLKEDGIIYEQEGLEQNVGVCWRCETPVEFIPTEQWFVETLSYKDKMLELGDKINWYPDYYKHRYEDWVENLKWDWCISRQRYYGVPFPVWYCRDCGEVIVEKIENLPVDPRKDQSSLICGRCGSEDMVPEGDVMDTWMTSSLTPQIALRWADDEEYFQDNFPMDMRPQSHDIIRTWAFYTILKSYFHHGSIPWEDVTISGYVYNKEGEGMSSSKGTGVSPDEIIDEYGADCLRYWAAGAGTGEDIIYREKDVIRGQKILTKLWNASNLVKMHLDGYEEKNHVPDLPIVDRWILSKTKKVIDECEQHYRDYDISKVREKISNFFKHVYCDNYLEMVKYRLYEGEDVPEEKREAARYTLRTTLLSFLKVFSPIIPYMTEEIYHQMFKRQEGERSIHESTWPDLKEGFIDETAEEVGGAAKDIIAEIRRWKSDNGIPLNQDIGKLRIVTPDVRIQRCEEDIAETLNAHSIQLIDEGEVEEKAVEVKPEYSKIGPKYEDKAKEIFETIEKVDPENIYASLKEKGEVEIDLLDSTTVTLNEDELRVKKAKVHEGEQLNSLTLGDTIILIEK